MTRRTKGSGSHLLPRPHQDNLTQAQYNMLLPFAVTDSMNMPRTPANATERAAWDELELRGYLHEQPAGSFMITDSGLAMMAKPIIG